LRYRLKVALDLLTTSGSVFVQIGDENAHLVRCLLDEVFGSENFLSSIAFVRAGGQTSEVLASTTDTILWYAKDKEAVKTRRIFLRTGGWAAHAQDQWIELPDGTRRRVEDGEPVPEGARLFTHRKLESATGSEGSRFPIEFEGKTLLPTRGWSTNADGVSRLKQANRLLLIGDSLRFIVYHDDFPLASLTNNWMDTYVSGFANKKIYVVETPTKVVERCILLSTDPGDLVLDPTCGSGTTAFAAEWWGRRWITVDTSRVAMALARARLMASRYPYFLLKDSPEGVAKEAELLGRPTGVQQTSYNVNKGFVYESVPRISLKSIVNNPEIKKGLSRKETEVAVRRGAEREVLLDKPFDDPKRIRVSGPFTVESLSPHRTLSYPSEPEFSGEGPDSARRGRPDFITVILDNLRKAGVQNTVKHERLSFLRIDPYPGTFINAEGEFLENEKTRRAAICIGPEYGTVGPDLLKEAAKEAVEGRGFDLLIVCGFAFDPYVSQEAMQYGKLTVLTARMNPDLSMGEDLLKKTGAGNLFTVFGEPDIDPQRRGKEIVLKLRGVDVYDPTTGQIRSHSTDDIACWFLDTDYNGESFFVRHAYFCGGNDPYERLKRALRADIDEEAWAAIYSTTSRPFEIPKSGKVAVKVINHYGDEVLKVIKLGAGQ
jgi:adenine-specific DNA-methyltransferase